MMTRVDYNEPAHEEIYLGTINFTADTITVGFFHKRENETCRLIGCLTLNEKDAKGLSEKLNKFYEKRGLQ